MTLCKTALTKSRTVLQQNRPEADVYVADTRPEPTAEGAAGVGVIGGLESVVDITCQPRRAVLLFESLL